MYVLSEFIYLVIYLFIYFIINFYNLVGAMC